MLSFFFFKNLIVQNWHKKAQSWSFTHFFVFGIILLDFYDSFHEGRS